jgi:protein associated with RNAse G/E
MSTKHLQRIGFRLVTSREVRVVYTKYDGRLHWHQTMHYLGADEHGTWLGAPAGTTARRGSEPPIVLEQPYVLLVPDGRWWTAVFNGEPANTDIYCDISTPPQWPNEGEVTMVDLDLDVLRLRADQRVLLDDADEFAEHQMRYSYPAEVISQAEQAAAWLQQAISAGSEPFAIAYRPWLDQVSGPVTFPAGTDRSAQGE